MHLKVTRKGKCSQIFFFAVENLLTISKMIILMSVRFLKVCHTFRYNAEKKKVGMYYSTPVYQFRMKCHLCDNHFEIKTDPAVSVILPLLILGSLGGPRGFGWVSVSPSHVLSRPFNEI